MTSQLLRSKKPDLQTRLEALREAVAIADGRLDDPAVTAGRAVVEQAGARLSLGPELTVVALAGATGSGKSSLFNALAGVDLAPVSVRRPTTARPQACVWGKGKADALLDWLDVPRRHHLDGAGPDGLVLLDLPDHDSRETSHRIEVDRLTEVVDLLAWVLDPQKYADATLHEDYLKPLRGHSSVMVFILNHIDELDAEARRACLVDLRRVLENDGLRDPVILASSASSGEGVDELRELIGHAVTSRRAVTERLEADVSRAADKLASTYSHGMAPNSATTAERRELVDVLVAAAGVELVAASVARSHRRNAALRVGWPFTRWLRRFRPDPLRRLHLGAAPGDRTSLPAASPAQRARVEVAIRVLSERSAGTLPPPWPRLALNAASRKSDELPELLDQTVATTDLASRPPRWWALGAGVQWVLAAAVLSGAVWLAALFVIDYLRLPDPPVPEWQEFPIPTLLLVGGCLLGLVLAFVGGLAARLGAARRAAVVRRRLRSAVAEVADAAIVRPLADELAAYEQMCAALARARS